MVSVRNTDEWAALPLVITGAVICFVAAVVVIVFRLEELWPSLSSSSRATVLVSAVGALGTSILAIATFATVHQNRRNLTHQERDRQKPIAIDVINKVIQPIFPRIEGDIKSLKNDSEWSMDWYGPDQPSDSVGNSPGSMFSGGILNEVDRTALRKLRNEYPELWEKMEEREELTKRGCKIGSEIGDEIRPRVKQYLRQEDLLEQNPDIETLMSATIRELDSYGVNHSDYELWENHREELIQILHAESRDQLSELRALEDELLPMTNEIMDDLISTKLDLRETYGISSEEIIDRSTLPRSM